MHTNLAVRFLYDLVKPQGLDEDVRRHQLILNIFLVSSIVLAGVATLLVSLYIWRLGPAYRGIPLLIPASITTLFICLYIASHEHLHREASYILIGIYTAVALYGSFRWGADIPNSLLMYALIIVMAGVLISTRAALLFTGVISTGLLSLYYFQAVHMISPSIYWKQDPIGVADIGMVILTLSIIFIVSWLSNREIEKSLKRARASEKALREQRDLLEVIVEERTKKLKEAQWSKMEQLYRFVAFGRVASGIFHDLATPLSLILLSLERIQAYHTAQEREDMKEIQTTIERALRGTKRIEHFIHLAQKQFQQKDVPKEFDIKQELEQVLQILHHRADTVGASLKMVCDVAIMLQAEPARFHQLVSNIIANAIDAYDGHVSTGPRGVMVEVRSQDQKVLISITDWGKGIAADHLAQIFNPFFTTKGHGKGIGLGLAISREIIEKDFHGSIEVESVIDQGTTFTLHIPILARSS